MTRKRLEHSYVRYRSRTGRDPHRAGSKIDAEAERRVIGPEKKRRGVVALEFQIGHLRGNEIEVYLYEQDFRVLADAMIEAAPEVALAVLSTAVSDRLQLEAVASNISSG